MKQIFFSCLVLCLSACSQQKTGQYPTILSSPSRDKETFVVTQRWAETSLKSKASQKTIPKAYLDWLVQSPNQQEVKAYKAFLLQHHLDNIAPDFELFQTARDWQKCNAQEFEIPPQEIWSNIIPTLQILKQLVERKILDDFTVTSVYRNFNLNRCAGGADSSKHVFNAALDFRIGSAQPSPDEQIIIQETKNKLCQFWQEQGMNLQMGLGVYASGQIHIDSAGYRTWGVDHRSTSSPCLAMDYK
ncbi:MULTISPECIES: D-Ala-D-Ala carboxypeptidase family metallohydrolase [unclassified Acinetobacter]|uniref:D-Ala-D-Ala carboxypeptidase family metallohydrolase n=1 Tax=unclassified Acinetobacter TaxID=196816 RepID=UPI00244C0C5B|nr:MULTISPECIES: D-Ala-D-Ala carboxypeptidase family metallohydrolase [unclassified Acinetobacter]MDH0033054.1 D-Ala-D-Ala carboxypeptidase family metallohydrolase [Acinetobacter sp. GD04021]MDH0888418.1 D-Ala-D-Ala carboxypeptidase family metallohydrolase [Acinetobacter sp. GD03873]MDH1084824.1 D-Ala-D-Ala carboxypeptidase family metallohydrolase [Acinetobacter sp. GD03983]MDH2191714.1 D-Ala-D-Ala carboxypeptidase family metallohydrolase [Acinetobacter sp. GD03645]MDH2205331.1 D-Ala-D-Ala car